MNSPPRKVSYEPIIPAGYTTIKILADSAPRNARARDIAMIYNKAYIGEQAEI